MKFLALLMLVIFTGHATSGEKDTRTPLEALHGDTMGELVLCQLSFKLAQLDPTADGANYLACIDGAPKKAQSSFRRALTSFSNKAQATQAIKNYYVAWMSTVRGVAPSIGADELRITYAARQSRAEQRLNELWAAVEMEAGFPAPSRPKKPNKANVESQDDDPDDAVRKALYGK